MTPDEKRNHVVAVVVIAALVVAALYLFGTSRP
jgi:hypothetical protein